MEWPTAQMAKMNAIALLTHSTALPLGIESLNWRVLNPISITFESLFLMQRKADPRKDPSLVCLQWSERLFQRSRWISVHLDQRNACCFSRRLWVISYKFIWFNVHFALILYIFVFRWFRRPLQLSSKGYLMMRDSGRWKPYCADGDWNPEYSVSTCIFFGFKTGSSSSLKTNPTRPESIFSNDICHSIVYIKCSNWLDF